MTNLLIQSLLLCAFLIVVVQSAPLTEEVASEAEVLAEREEPMTSNQKEDGVKSPQPDTKPVAPPQPPVQPLVSNSGQVLGATSAANGIGIGNLINFRRFGPWQDIGLDLLGGLVQVTVNRTPGNRNVAVRVGNQEINVG